MAEFISSHIVYIGIFAAILTTVSFFPQVLKTHNTKHTKDLSLVMYLLFSIGLMLWTVYGIYLNDVPIIAANTITLAMSLYILFLKVKYG
jgi:MtN3 and saliva related transmembrane protein